MFLLAAIMTEDPTKLFFLLVSHVCFHFFYTVLCFLCTSSYSTAQEHVFWEGVICQVYGNVSVCFPIHVPALTQFPVCLIGHLIPDVSRCSQIKFCTEVRVCSVCLSCLLCRVCMFSPDLYVDIPCGLDLLIKDYFNYARLSVP